MCFQAFLIISITRFRLRLKLQMIYDLLTVLFDVETIVRTFSIKLDYCLLIIRLQVIKYLE